MCRIGCQFLRKVFKIIKFPEISETEWITSIHCVLIFTSYFEFPLWRVTSRIGGRLRDRVLARDPGEPAARVPEHLVREVLGLLGLEQRREPLRGRLCFF